MPDFVLYRAFYCGICKRTGQLLGQLPRFATNYDVTFLSVLLHDAFNQSLEFETSGCVLNPFRKKVTVCSNELLDKIVYTNVILTFHKLNDAVLDKEGASKRVARGLFKRAYSKAKKACPEVDDAVRLSYRTLFEAEKQNIKSIDRMSEHFASLLSEIARILLEGKISEDYSKLFYNIGKFVYLADALDDIDEDFKKGRYNPFLALYPDFNNRKEYFLRYEAELGFALTATVNRAIECSNRICFDKNGSLVYNIIHKGLRAKVKEIFESERKLKKPKI